LLVGTIISRKLFPTAKYVSVVLITAGISMFMLQKVKKGSGDESDDASQFYGRTLIFVSLLCDGLTGSLQDALVGNSKPSAYHLMMWNNLWAVCYLLIGALFTGGIINGLHFAARHPSVIPMMAAFALTSAAGQMFIYYTVRHYGSLVCTMVTTTRKFFTILLSVLWFGHHLSLLQWIAVAIVFAGIAIDDSFAAKKAHQHTPLASAASTAGEKKD
jgi:UDP-galactose transporter B1